MQRDFPKTNLKFKLDFWINFENNILYGTHAYEYARTVNICAAVRPLAGFVYLYNVSVSVKSRTQCSPLESLSLQHVYLFHLYICLLKLECPKYISIDTLHTYKYHYMYAADSIVVSAYHMSYYMIVYTP